MFPLFSRLFALCAPLSEGIINGRSRFRIGSRPAPKNYSNRKHHAISVTLQV